MTFVEMRDRLHQMNPVDLAEKLETLNFEELVTYILLLDKELLADTFALLSPEKKHKLVNTLSDDHVIEIIDRLEADELVDTLQELPANMVNELLNIVDHEKAAAVNMLLGYDFNSVGSIMTIDYLRFSEKSDVQEVISEVMSSQIQSRHLELIWVTDDQLKLKGFVYLADLIRSSKRSLSELMRPISFAVQATDDQENLIDLAVKYQFSDIPVVDLEGRMVGIVPTEWTVNVLSEEFGEDLNHLSGITERVESSYQKSSIWELSRSRATWLIICLVTATLTSFIIQRYEATLASSVLLAAYIPMLMDSGGNAGAQSSTTIIQALNKEKLSGNKVILKEAMIGVVVGIILVGVNLARMMIIDQAPANILLTVSITLFVTIILSKVLGGLLPILAEKLKIDPTVMSGPIITTIVDTLVLIVYFEIASLLLNF